MHNLPTYDTDDLTNLEALVITLLALAVLFACAVWRHRTPLVLGALALLLGYTWLTGALQ